MPYRLGKGTGNDVLVVDGIYHVYNRTIDGIAPFSSPKYAMLFFKLLHHYKTYHTAFSQHSWKTKSTKDLVLSDIL